ncbi:MAG TPA: oxygenase MpaB family protein [Actinomycetota bacterium]|nr:oxygenase MpaB family protein [Actinomycetota bacterium]
MAPESLSKDRPDPGLFGPDSASWQVHGETTVLFGGARALLMHAAHPLLIAAGRDTGFYKKNPWQRLERTLQLTYAITFGTVEEATTAVEHINDVHRSVRGLDEVTGLTYDAFDPELLLWVHASLVDSALLFERLTVGRLGDEGRQRFHEEQMVVAELLGLPRDRIPPAVPALRGYIDEMVASGGLNVTDDARDFAGLFRDPPREATWRPILRLVAWWAFATLPPPIAEQYGMGRSFARATGLRASLTALRVLRPALPARFRRILPAREARERVHPTG